MSKHGRNLLSKKTPDTVLFSDEKNMYQKMKADNVPDDKAFAMLAKRRYDIL